jgi:hypothetical protein
MSTDEAHAEYEKVEKDVPKQGHVVFTITYDDTGAETKVTAAGGWRLREVIDKAYEALGETPRPGDRVEAKGVSLEPYFNMRVEEFVDRKIAPDLHFNIVSHTGGAAEPGARTRP